MSHPAIPIPASIAVGVHSTDPEIADLQKAVLALLANFNANDFSFAHAISPSRPSLTNPLGFPQGDDFYASVSGPADFHLANLPTDVTGTQNLVGGGGAQTITTTNVLGIAIPSTGVSLVLEPDGANQETITSANWALVSGSNAKLTITPTKNHTEPFTIRQMGGGFFDMGSVWQFNFKQKDSYINVKNAEGTGDILHIEEFLKGCKLKFFNDGTFVGQISSSGSTIRYYGEAGVGTGGFLFYSGAATGQSGLFVFQDNETDANTAAIIDSNAGGIRLGSCTVATLGAPTNNVMRFATDATRPSDPTVGGGTGGLCIRANGRWYTP